MGFYKEKFVKIRKEQRWKTSKLADACGVSRQSLTQWESGRANPSEKHIRRLARILDVPLSQISTLRDEVPTSEINVSETVGKVLSFSDTTSDKLHENYLELVRKAKRQYQGMEETSIVVKAILNSIPSIFYVKGVNLRYLVASKGFIDNASLQNSFQIFQKTDYDFFPKDEAKKNNEEDLQVVVSGKPVVDREDYIIGSRKKRLGLVSKTPILDNGKIVGLLGHIIDITEKRDLEIIQNLISQSIDNLGISLSVYDINKKIAIYTNKECRKIFGIDNTVPDSNIGQYWLDNIVHPEDREEQAKYVASMIPGEERPHHRTYRIIHPEKGIRTIKVFATDVIEFLDRKYIATLSVDITDKEKNEPQK